METQEQRDARIASELANRHWANALIGPQLDHAVAIACGYTRRSRGDLDYWFDAEDEPVALVPDGGDHFTDYATWSPTTNWEHGGPLIEKFDFNLTHGGWLDNSRTPDWLVNHERACNCYEGSDGLANGETILLAICRAIVVKALREGKTPEELLP